MRKKTIIFLGVAIAALFISGCCCKDKEQEITVLVFASSRDAEYNFAGRKYLFLIYKQGEDYFFRVTFLIILKKVQWFSPVIWAKMLGLSPTGINLKMAG